MWKVALSSEPQVPISITVFVGVVREARDEDMTVVDHLVVAGSV
jgi:hypothetical protein